MDDLADELEVEPVLVSSLRRDPGWHDIRALISLIGIMWRKSPQIVHTHAAKAGTLGRLAALATSLGRGRSAVIVHTFHGHSLTGYFSAPKAAAYRWIERVLARRTAALIAVSEEVRDELVALGVAPPERFEVIPLGFDLSRFSSLPESRATARRAVRAQLGIAPDAVVITLIARLVPIKRVDRFLTAATMLLDHQEAHFLVVGDGELRESLQRSSAAETLGSRITWAGFRRDIPEVCFASDVVVLCSDNEGTPVSLIEAAAAGLPTISTRVGGAGTVVRDGATGILVDADDGSALAGAVRKLLDSEATRKTMGSAGQAHVLRTFSLDRLIGDLDALYHRLLEHARAGKRPG
jgi:glycosyltransferase involved in cell wall biosynthesis